MPLPLCTVAAETAHLAVGHGVAIVSIEARVRGRSGGCTVDAGAVLRAREEGRAPPELVAFRTEIDGRPASMGGPSGRVSVDVTSASATVRFVAVLRGDRFAAVPLSADPSVIAAPVSYRVSTESVWGPNRVGGIARWTDTGAPVVITVDPSRDREPPTLSLRIVRDTPIPVLVADAGPRLPGEPTVSSEEDRRRALSRGGVDALSVLLGDLPLSVATASDAATAVVRLRETARAIRAASVSGDPLLVAVGQRLATAIVTGFSTCARSPATVLPPRWPAPPRELQSTGLLEDPESGCPRIADLLAVNHPDVRFSQEGGAALAEASTLPLGALPRIGPLERRTAAKPEARRRARPILAVAVATLVFLAFAAVALSRSSRSR